MPVYKIGPNIIKQGGEGGVFSLPGGGFACESYSTEKAGLTAPYCLDMSDADYMTYPVGNPVAVVNGGATKEDEPTGSYNGGHCCKIVPPPNPGDQYAGLGNFNFNALSVGTQMNMRYLVYWGYDCVQGGVKINIMNDGDELHDRPMVISRELLYPANQNAGFNYMIPIPSQNIVESPTIYQDPDDPTFCIAGSGVTVGQGNYAHQWVCWEFEIITTSGSPILNFYVHTRDGVVARGQGNPFATHTWTDGETDLYRAAVGWYWGPGWTISAESYLKMSDVVIRNGYIGPPAGFLQ